MPDDNQSPAGVPLDDFALETPAKTETKSDAASAATETQPTVPEKYKGKSIEDLINMHQNAERRLSQQGNELGEVRRLADQLIGIKAIDNTKKVERVPVKVDELLADPDKVLTQTIEAAVSARDVKTNARLAEMEREVAQRDFVTRYPTHQEDMANPEFIDWIKKNPVRSQLAGRAYQNDYMAASGLWSLWEEHKSAVADTSADKTAQRKETVRKATTQKAGNTEGAPERTYSRAKLMDLRMKVADGDQAAIERWNNKEFQAALVKAYADGRVK